ncbi:MAG: AAA family ATPase [Desulfobacteraceae bacterium]|jgi:endopeptidase Clp ATP-binding regulatory subunit ClpX
MSDNNEKIPDPKEIEKELGEFLNKKFGGNVKIISPGVLARKPPEGKTYKDSGKKRDIHFDLKPEELIAYLDQYIIKQDKAKAILATKICTHFNRIKHIEASGDNRDIMVGGIKSNILMAGPTGVGKTYMIRLIAKKLGVPFVKGDATKFTETGYVGGNVEDLVRDLVREADDDIELAQYGIVYIDEIDKIASAHNLIGADISRTGVQRALLKPMEDTDVELKVPHDPVSMLQEMERYQKTGKKDKQVVNTANILFIVSGAFGGLPEIIKKRTAKQSIGFGSEILTSDLSYNLLSKMKTEDLVAFGFESEFVGRLPIRAVFERLTEDDLFSILKNPNNPVILGKKLDFASYGISAKFTDQTLRHIAKNAYAENTGARGLVNAIEELLLPFETRLPSESVRYFPITLDVVQKPEDSIKSLCSHASDNKWCDLYKKIEDDEREDIRRFVDASWKQLSLRHNLTLTQYRIDHVAHYYSKNITSIGNAVDKIRSYYDEVKKLELTFFSEHDINIIFEEDAVDFLIGGFIDPGCGFEEIYAKFSSDFELGLKLIQEKTGRNRFFISREALTDSEVFLNNLVKRELSHLEGDKNRPDGL